MKLQARTLGFAIGTRQLLEHVEVAAPGGEFIAVIGPTGAGKSTLLRLLAGLAQPPAGEVLLDGMSLADVAPRELARRRAWLPQNPRCDWPLSVERLVGLGLTPLLPAFGDFTDADRVRIDAALADCDLVAQRHQAATTLSGGELARAMLARALVSDPAVLLVDEPLAGLDPRHALDAARRLQQLARERGKLVIAAVHDLDIALRRASRVWALSAGRLVADGVPEAVITPLLLREHFGVEARVAGAATRGYVDFLD